MSVTTAQLVHFIIGLFLIWLIFSEHKQSNNSVNFPQADYVGVAVVSLATLLFVSYGGYVPTAGIIIRGLAIRLFLKLLKWTERFSGYIKDFRARLLKYGEADVALPFITWTSYALFFRLFASFMPVTSIILALMLLLIVCVHMRNNHEHTFLAKRFTLK